MPRPRIQQQAICYHLYNRCINRDRLFEDERGLRPFAAGIQLFLRTVPSPPPRHPRRALAWAIPDATGRRVEEDLCLTRSGRYIERNPVRAGPAEFVWDWARSSAGFDVLGRPDELTDLDVQFAVLDAPT